MLQNNNKAEKIIIVSTGGTIEKTYDEFEGSLGNRESEVKKRIIAKLRLPYTELEVFSIIAKDSLHFTEYDRTILVKTIQTQLQKNHPIVVLHGTDTMARSAERVFKDIPDPKQSVVFTGAMVPMGFEDSDARQNVTEALLASKLLSPGIYISFHNKVFKVPGVRKNPTIRTFEYQD
ncbi:MAG: asparaginase [Halobacteriovorax sp.]|nr:asparaginase [Halobacteriovorax sp.]|tara:strand:+ start:53320 stop:53850 length:531 start_codon:yes stop_codon:yes gene_type:complete